MQTAFSDYTDPTKVVCELNEGMRRNTNTLNQTMALNEGFNDAAPSHLAAREPLIQTPSALLCSIMTDILCLFGGGDSSSASRRRSGPV